MGGKKLLRCLSAQLRPPTITQHMDYIQVTICLPFCAFVIYFMSNCLCLCLHICSWSPFSHWLWASSLRQEPRTSRVRVDYNMPKKMLFNGHIFENSLQIGLELFHEWREDNISLNCNLWESRMHGESGSFGSFGPQNPRDKTLDAWPSKVPCVLLSPINLLMQFIESPRIEWGSMRIWFRLCKTYFPFTWKH